MINHHLKRTCQATTSSVSCAELQSHKTWQTLLAFAVQKQYRTCLQAETYAQGRRRTGAWRGHCPLTFHKGDKGDRGAFSKKYQRKFHGLSKSN